MLKFLVYLLIGIATAIIAVLINYYTSKHTSKALTPTRLLIGIGVCVVVVAALSAFGGVSDDDEDSDSNAATPPTTVAPQLPVAAPTIGTTPPATSPSATDDPGNVLPFEPVVTEQYLSELTVADHNKESGTGQWGEGSRTINGKPFGHSVAMNAGCQNDDGGDYWLDYTVDGTWQQLTATIGVTDRSSTSSRGTYKVLDAATGRTITSGEFSAGREVALDADVTGVVRLRIFINDPNAPSQACGFEKISTAVVWGDAKLTK